MVAELNAGGSHILLQVNHRPGAGDRWSNHANASWAGVASSSRAIERIWQVIVSPRDRAWFALMLRAGLRVGEAELHLADLHAYQSQRLAQGVAPATINRSLNYVMAVLREQADRGQPVDSSVFRLRPLPRPAI